MPEISKLICAEIDWNGPGLKGSRAAASYHAGDFPAAAVEFVAHWRTRDESRTGYRREDIAHFRAVCPESEIRAAHRRTEMQLAWDMTLPFHSNPFAALGPETLFLLQEPALFERMAMRVVEHRPAWETGYSFGGTGGICEVLRCLFLIKECPDAALIPWLGWLIFKAREEWGKTVRWSEASLGTSGHNWWIHALGGFYMAGLLLSEFHGLAKFSHLAGSFLDREARLLFEEDGWSKEGAPGYHEYAALGLIEMAHLASRNGVILSEYLQRKLRTIADASWKVILPDGKYPIFGDYVPLSLYPDPVGQGRTDRQPIITLRRHAARFSLGHSKFVAESLDPGWTPIFGATLPDFGQDLLPDYRRLPAIPPPGPDTALPDGGIYVMRQNWSPRADCLALTAGPTGSRVSSHGHSDLLSFELYSRGRRILVDNGYGLAPKPGPADPIGRMWRVGTESHNTVTVDGQEQVKILGEFMYGQYVVPTVDDWISSSDYAYFSGVHEGYQRLENPVSGVRRKIFYLRGRYWIVIDRLTSITEAEHEYQLNFHIGIPVELDQDGRAVTSGPGGNLLIAPVAGFAGSPKLQDHPHPMEGYENPMHLSYTRRTVGRDLFVTLLVPFLDKERPVVSARVMDVECEGRKLTPWEGTGLEITIDGTTHFYFDQHMEWNLPWSCGSHAGHHRLYHSECLI